MNASRAMQLPRRERGAAILTALIIVTVVATLASAMVWQQWRAVQVETAERARAQAAWVLNGALDWARLILREDGRTQNSMDHLGEPWAVPLAEARLSTFLAADRENTDDSVEAFLSGQIEDAQSRYNVRNVVNSEGKRDLKEVDTLKQLFEMVQANPELADRLAAAIQLALATSPADLKDGGENVPLMPQQTSQLRWLGMPPDVLEKLKPYITVLPEPTPINVNTAPREVIAAVLGVDLGLADRLVQMRSQNPFPGLQQITEQLPSSMQQGGNESRVTDARINTQTRYFEVRGRLRLEHRVLEERSLVRRQGIEIVPLFRERVTSSE